MDVIGLGTVVVDHLVILPNAPIPDQKTSILSDHFQIGGPVPTALTLLRRLGWRCSFISTWGNDSYGQMIENDFSREDLDYAMSANRAAARTGFAHVWVDQQTGSRTIAAYRPPEGIPPTCLQHPHLRSARLLHLDGWPGELAIDAARLIRQHGGMVSLDTGSPKPHMRELLQHVDVVNCPRRFIQTFFKTDDLHAASAALLEMGPRLVTITSGADGALLRTSDQLIEKPAIPINAIDTTGAGDIFCGGLIHGLLNDWPAEQLLDFAMTAAAAKCRTLGNRTTLPIHDTVNQENQH